MFSCRGRLAFLPSSHRRRPNGKFARPDGPFLLHPDGLRRKPFCDLWGSIINTIWAAYSVDVEEAWDRAADPNPDLTFGESPNSPQLYQTEPSLVRVLVSPFSEEPPQHKIALPQPEALLKDVLVPPPPEEPPESVLSRPRYPGISGEYWWRRSPRRSCGCLP